MDVVSYSRTRTGFILIEPATPSSIASATTRRPCDEKALLEAVADTSRRRVLDLLLQHGEGTPTGLAAELPFTRQAVAKHLDVAVPAMAKVAARWDARVDAIKRKAEKAVERGLG